MLLRSTTARACIYCHVVEAPDKMYGGDTTLALAGEPALGWNEFYGHTTGCTSLPRRPRRQHLQGRDGRRRQDPEVLGVKNLGTIPLVVQPEVYAAATRSTTARPTFQRGLSASATAAGVTPLQAAVTAQCSICHASYAYGEAEVNANYLNAELFQPASWATANGATTRSSWVTPPTRLRASWRCRVITYTGSTPTT